MQSQATQGVVTDTDRQVIARYLASRDQSITDIEQAAPLWPDIANECWRRRVSGITDVLSTDLLKAIADGKVNFPALCASIKS